MPHIPVVGRMPDRTERLVYADPDVMLAIKAVLNPDACYLVDLKTEQKFETLQRTLTKTKQRQARMN